MSARIQESHALTPARQRSTRYRFVDFAAHAQPGFRNRIVTVDEVPALVAEYEAEECYASIFHFSDDILLFLEENRVQGRPSVAGYDGKVWAPFLPLDIDAHPPDTALTKALELARRTYDLLVERWEVPPAAVHPYFSGAKGFHLLVDTRALGRLAPSRNLHRIFSRLRLEILRALPESARALFDLALGDKVRLLRLPNTRHGRSGLFKIALTPDELHTCPTAEIRALAREPRPLTRVTAAGLLPVEAVEAAPELERLFRRARRALGRERGAHPYRLGQPPARPEEALCAARLEMWRTNVPPGGRNNVAIRLASAFRLAGYGRGETLDLIRAWNRRQQSPLPEREIESIGHSAFARPYPYTYGCHDEVIRRFCPYADRLGECDDYREQHPRSERGPRAGQ